MQSIVYTVEFQKCWLEANLWLNDCRCNTIINVLSELCHCSNYFCCYKVLGLIAMATEESSGLICPQCLIRFDPEFNIQQQTECIDLNLTRVEYFPQNLASIVKYFSLLGRYSNTHFSGRDDGHILGWGKPCSVRNRSVYSVEWRGAMLDTRQGLPSSSSWGSRQANRHTSVWIFPC